MRCLPWIATLFVGCSDTAGTTPDASSDAMAIDAAPCDALGVVWEPTATMPVIGNGACPGWHCIAASDPAIVRGPDGVVAIYFTTVGIVPDGNGSFVSEMNIGRATNVGGAWSVSPDQPMVHSPVNGAWDRSAETVSVMHDGTQWHMWYLGYKADGFVDAGIGHMTSTDGLAWARPAQPIYRPTAGAWDSALLTGPTAMRGPDGVYRVYFSGVSSVTGKTGVGLLTSSDGEAWTPHPNNPVFVAGGSGAWDDTVLEQTVRYHAGKYWMLYSGYQGPLETTTSLSIGLATSADANPVLRPGPAGSWNELRVLAPDLLVEEDGSFTLAAYGQNKTDPTSDQPGRTNVWRSTCR
jgi:hypothetical protein